MATSKGSHLVLILDLCPSRELLADNESLNHWFNSVIAFANSYLLLSEKNALTVIGCHADAK